MAVNYLFKNGNYISKDECIYLKSVHFKRQLREVIREKFIPLKVASSLFNKLMQLFLP